MFFYSTKASLDNHQKPQSALMAPLLQSQSVTVAGQELKYGAVKVAL